LRDELNLLQDASGGNEISINDLVIKVISKFHLLGLVFCCPPMFCEDSGLGIVGEFRKTCHPRNVEVYEIHVMSFQGHRTHKVLES
jgi:hypothetical protein